eukprot:458761_1
MNTSLLTVIVFFFQIYGNVGLTEYDDSWSQSCMTTKIQNALISTVSNWYFAINDGGKYSATVSQFNPIIHRIFNCDRRLDVCIGTNIENDECSIASFRTCGQLKDANDGYWSGAKGSIIGIQFGQMDLRCRENGNVLVRLTKTVYTKTGKFVDDDMWIFERVAFDSKNERSNWRARSWEVYAQSANDGVMY